MLVSRAMSESVSNTDLFAFFAQAVKRGVEYVRLAKSGRTYFGKHANWPHLLQHDNGLPYISHLGEGPPDYGEVIQSHAGFWGSFLGDEKPLDFKRESCFLRLHKYAKEHNRLSSFLGLKHDKHEFGKFRLLGFVGSLLDRYVSTHGPDEFDVTKLQKHYVPLETYLLNDTLPVTVVVPILLVQFESNHSSIDESMRIERLSEDFQLSKSYRGYFGDTRKFDVEDAATHGLFITGRSVENKSMHDGRIMPPEWYPLNKVDRFFAALRIVTGHPTGYAQLLTLPLGWASYYAANLTPIEGPRTENYPASFRIGSWQDAIISASEIEMISQTYRKLGVIMKSQHASRLDLALQRLNLCSVRTRDEDGIIDSMIAMEALLSDGNQEMTHKVAMRVAGLYKANGSLQTEQAYREMKRIYQYRSSIAHGARDSSKYSITERPEGPRSTVNIAVEYLRETLSILLEYPEFLEPSKIDMYLLTGKLERSV
jgi:hypothetical protein